MRVLLTITFCALMSLALNAQISLTMPDLVKSKRPIAMAVSTADLSTVSVPARRGGGSTQQTVWIISRAQDRYSSAIQDAANRGRAFKEVMLKIGSNEHVLDNAHISNFSISASGSGSTETFYIHFSNS